MTATAFWLRSVVVVVEFVVVEEEEEEVAAGLWRRQCAPPSRPSFLPSYLVVGVLTAYIPILSIRSDSEPIDTPYFRHHHHSLSIRSHLNLAELDTSDSGRYIGRLPAVYCMRSTREIA